MLNLDDADRLIFELTTAVEKLEQIDYRRKMGDTRGMEEILKAAKDEVCVIMQRHGLCRGEKK